MTMFGRSIPLLSALLFVLLLLAPAIHADNEEQFQDLVRDIPDDRLHAALHDYNGAKFKHVKLAKRQSNTTTASNINTISSSRSTPVTLPSTPTTSSPAARPTTSTTENPTTTAATPTTTPKRGTTSSTSKITRTVTGPDGVSTLTESTVVVATPTETDQPVETSLSPSPSNTPPGLQNVGLRVSGRDSAIVAVIAALGFFML